MVAARDMRGEGGRYAKAIDPRCPRAVCSSVRPLPAALKRSYRPSSKLTPRVACLALAIAAAPAFAQTVVVHAGRMVDVDRGKVLADQRDHDRERARSCASSPGRCDRGAQGAKVVDWSRYTVLPGLMDMHTHLADEGQSADPGDAAEEQPGTRRVHRREERVGHACARLHHGARCRRLSRPRPTCSCAMRSTPALMPGPRMFVAGAYITVTGGGGEITGLPKGTVVPEEFRVGVADDEQQVRQKVNYLFDNGADFIKVIATGAVLAAGTEPGHSEYTRSRNPRRGRRSRQARGSFVAAHAHGAEGIKHAVRAGVRSIEHGSLMDDEAHRADEAARHLAGRRHLQRRLHRHRRPRSRAGRKRSCARTLETTETQREGFRKAVAAGVNIAYGTDSGVYPHGDNGAPVRLHGALRDDADAGDPVGDDPIRRACSARRRSSARSRPASSPT